ncbi:MAG TPA: fibronectin type III domain-containing protein [Kofleriaceae bacterium]|nr:fibronectin type III domain-containing protein [Kofleriaceae bacterium]
MRSAVVVSALSGLSACAELHLSSTGQDIDAPANVTAKPVTDTEILVSWTAVPGAFAYFVLDKRSTDTTFVNVATTLDPGTTQLVIGLTPNTSYDFEIITEAPGSFSPPSAPVSATTFVVAPGAPTDIVATPVLDSEIDLSWTNFPGATATYVFESQAGGPSNFLTTVLPPGDTFAATGLAANTMYCYQLASHLADGSYSGLSTPPVCATTAAGPQPPTGLLATAISGTSILVQWQPAAGAAKYDVRESQSGGPFMLVGVSLASEQTFEAGNLQPSTGYCFTVSTVFPDNTESAPSPLACATTLGSGNNGGFQGYWKLDERSGTTALDSSGWNRHGTITNAVYSIADRAQLDDNRSAISFTASPDSAITVAPAPAFDLLDVFTVAFWAKLPAAADVTFIGMRGAGCGALGWEIGQDASGLHFAGQTQTVAAGAAIPVGVWTHVAVTYASGTMQIFVNGVQTASAPFVPDNTLQASLNMGHVAGCAGGAVLMDDVQILARAMSSTEVSAIGTLPPPPTNVHVTSKTSATLVFAWDPVPGATQYIISKSTAPGNETFYTHSVADPPSFGDSHLTPDTQYSYNVRAVVGNLFSNPSNEVVDTTKPPPAPPTNVVASVSAPDRILVQWTAAPDAFVYFVFQSTAGAPFVFAGSVEAPGTAFEAVNLSPATTYTFQIQTEDIVQTVGPPSLPASATTP